MISKQLFKNDNGQGIVEFALIVPVLLLLVFGIVEFSILSFNKSILNQAAKEGLRMAAVKSDISEITSIISSIIKPILGETAQTITQGIDDEGNQSTVIKLTSYSGNSATVYITPVYSNLTLGNKVRLCIAYNMKFITPLASLFGNDINLKSVSYTRFEAP